MNLIDSYIEDDRLLRSTVVRDLGDNGTINRQDTIITKEEFLMCYREWVEKPQMRRNAARVKR